jgi:thymidine phosphorylase
VRNAFIRARRRIEISHSKSPEQLAELITPENVEVVGLKEFLQQTAPDVDPRLLDKPLEDAAQTIRDRGQWEAKLSARRKYLSVLEDGKARQMLKDFLQDAAVGREHLRRAMNAKPQGMPSPILFFFLTCQHSRGA